MFHVSLFCFIEINQHIYGFNEFIVAHSLYYFYIFLSVSIEGPAPPTPSSSAPPLFGLWWPWWVRRSPPRHRAPGWCKDRGCPPAPSPLLGTVSQTPPPTQRAKATSCVIRKQEGNRWLWSCSQHWYVSVDTVQQWFACFIVVLRKITQHVVGSRLIICIRD